MEILLGMAGAVLITATALAFLRSPRWWVRACDFPRLQIACALALVLALHLAVVEAGPPGWLLRALMAIAIAVQVVRMLPYTALARPEVEASALPAPRHGIRLLFANVLQTNHRAERLLALIREADPDIVLALETDDWWARALAVLEASHPHAVLQPQDNTYGMVLYSRLPLIDPEVRFLIDDDVPSIHAGLQVGPGAPVRLHCLHPRPPAPSEADSSIPRDAELLVVGRAIRREPGPAIVMGDMNDVAWSRTSALFRAVSGLLDPRIGRGFYNTFHAGMPWLRYPLDHFFHSSDFRLVSFRRLGHFGSDHFPVFIHLSHEPQARATQPEPRADAAEQQEASEKIEAARAPATIETRAAPP